jgi:hypothetical protein
MLVIRLTTPPMTNRMTSRSTTPIFHGETPFILSNNSSSSLVQELLSVITLGRSQFYPARGGISAFTEFCTRNSIEHIVASVRRPSTIGKIEAFHKAYTIEASIYPTHK